VTVYVAMLRAVNVGGHNRVPMARWRDQLAALGYTGVRTHLQSGNAVFEAGRCAPGEVAATVAAALADDPGVQVPVVVRSGPQLAAVVAAHPLREVAADPARLQVTFLSHDADPEPLRDIAAHVLGDDVARLLGRELYVWSPAGIHRSKLTPAFVERRCGGSATARNWNTVTALAQLALTPPALTPPE
jgi:uncharacterized protein (DUF1697 family)